MAELVVDGLCSGYHDRQVLTGIALRFSAGQLHAILGPNGAGKTTLLRTIAGVLRPRAGRLLWNEDGNGTNLCTLSPAQRAAYLAYVPQLAANDIPLTVREAVEIAGRPRHGHPGARTLGADGGSFAKRIAQLLVSLGLETHAEFQCSTLSGGVWRRVLLAQGLAQSTPLLLLDEPTAFLDPPAKLETLALLRHLAKTLGLCIICVLHDPGLALRFSHTASAIVDGRVLASGQAAKVITPLTLRLLYGAEIDPHGNSIEEPINEK